MRRLSLTAAFALLLVAALAVDGRTSDLTAVTLPQLDLPADTLPLPQDGTFPEHWIDGTDCGNEPAIQVHQYAEGLYILRQSKCSSFEAPFLYLILGMKSAILLDTGSTGNPPVESTVRRLVVAWRRKYQLPQYRLIAAHTHGHFDHIANDNQFLNKTDTVLIPPTLAAQITFWGFEDYPFDVRTLDLGGRVLEIFGTPGHQNASISVYDRKTQLLLTGDIVYPGHLFVFSQPEWDDFTASLMRLVQFAETRPVRWVVGCHIEMSDVPGVSYQYGTTQHPNEHPLELPPSILEEILLDVLAQPVPTCSVKDEYVIHPVFKCGLGFNG